ncbi:MULTISPECIES: nucleoside deaminase [unclassified Nonomuraea]|uniref:nucleoside deaminase n=1 Tax=unclassified Nonomuraea TaxID=2593643 RepID=UPI0033E2110C
MRLALAEAASAGARGEVPVGAVVLGPAGPAGREVPGGSGAPGGLGGPGDAVLAAAGNDRESGADPTAHAEVLALREAARVRGGWRLDGCTLVVTLEPCTMCAGAAVLARVDRIVYGAVDEKGGAVGSLWDVVRDRRLNHRPEVVMGVMAEECAAVLSEFFATRRIR